MSKMTVIDPGKIRHLSTDDLREHLSRAIEMTAQAISYMAAVVHELERRGEDLSDMRSGLMPYLRAVAANRLAPQALVAFAGQRLLLRSMERLPIDQQAAIAATKAVAVRRGNDVVTVDARDLRWNDIKNIEGAGSNEIPSPPDAVSREAPRQMTVTAVVSADEHRAIVRRAEAEGVTICNVLRGALGLPALTAKRGRQRILK